MQTTDKLATKAQGTGRPGAPTLVLMHFLGGSSHEWDEVIALLGDHIRTVALDLPGFGDSAGIPGYTVREMADAIEDAVQDSVTGPYILVGHSMSGTVAMVAARRAIDRQSARGDTHLSGLVLVAPSPPGPEPMGEDKRTMMLGLLSERHDDDRARARSYITKNELRDIPADVEERASNEVLRMNRSAWVAWLMHGSKEDWAAHVGILDLPALVIAGEQDLSLGPRQQRELTLPHLSRAELKMVENCSHLVPMEKPEQMATMLRDFLATLTPTSVPAEYLDFIAGERVAPKTREVLELRMAGPAPADGVLSPDQITTLRAMLARIIPQDADPIDLTGTILARLATGKGDGWRYAVLPEDAQAYREGLDALAARDFASLAPEAQDAILQELAAKPGSPEARWFEEVRGDAVTAYMAHPATLARIGYGGIGVGGANTPYNGYVTLGPNQREPWEPLPAGTAAE
jgi:pimeloyl-ACP methyl ester carboxylesterase